MCASDSEQRLGRNRQILPGRRWFSPLVASALCLAFTVPILSAQSKYQTIKAFGFAPQSSSFPRAGVIEGSDGALYGTTESGGSNNFGTVYRIGKDGADLTILKSFAGSDGLRPNSRLIAVDNFLYGTTVFGGASTSNRGTIFRLRSTGTDFTTVHQFAGTDGALPHADLMQAADGSLYGVTSAGGVSNLGTVFRLRPDNGDLTIIKGFLGGDGASPYSRLVQGIDGMLYGTTTYGGISNQGTIFKLDCDGGNFEVLKHFLGTNDGAAPYAGLVFGTNGWLFGTTHRGGDLGRGTLFTIDPAGAGYVVLNSFGGPLSDQGNPYGLTLVHDLLFGVTFYGGSGSGTVFCLNQDGSDFRTLKAFERERGDAIGPSTPLYHASDGFLYGTAGGGDASGGTIFRLKPDGSGYAIVRSFNASGYDGSYPRGYPIRGLDGLLYGTTWSGGSNNLGTVFKMHPDGSGYEILKSFTAADGYWPYARLLQTADGVLFGALFQGGSGGHGAIFKVNTNGTGFAIVKAFSGTATDGYSPYGGLMQARDGMVYGTTVYGGEGGGVIFRMDRTGAGFTVIKKLNDQNRIDDAYCFAALIQGLDGALYGTTAQGGSHFKGTVFKIDVNGSNHTVLRSFTGTNGDGAILHGELLQLSNGVLYGVTELGGISNCGTIFKVNADGTGYEILRRFTGTNGDGRQPFGGLVRNGNGLLYGVTTGGGLHRQGTVFQISPDGTGYIVVHSFNDGANVQGLLQIANGTLFGSTWGGGAMRYGTVFALEPGPGVLPPTLTAAGVEVSVAGIPGRTYTLQRASGVGGPWTSIGNVILDTSGGALYLDTELSQQNRFYRAVFP
jgi:uncharacterized repeat protein (TIGR03803 family)